PHPRVALLSDHPRHLTAYPTRRSSDLVDIAHYIIASARLLHRSPPARAAKLAAAALHSVTELAGPSAWAIVGLAAHFTMCREKEDRKSTRLNSSHVKSSYAVFCSKKKN